MKQAKWIWIDGKEQRDSYARFYDTFEWNCGKAILEISCDSNYELYINGKLAGFGQYADYPYDKVYDRIDVTEFCKVGENRLCILVWYWGNDCSTYYPNRPMLIYELSENGNIIAFSDGNTLCDHASDYVSGREKIITSQLGYSYTYDARNYDGWKSSDYVPKGCRKAVELTDCPTALRERPIEKLRLKPYVSAKKVGGLDQVYDLGRETVGYLSVFFRAPEGATVNIAWGEHLVVENGTQCVPRKIGNRDFSVELIGNGKWVEFSDYMRRLGLRYLQVTCSEEVEFDWIRIDPVEYPLTPLLFHAGTPLRQQIYDTALHTLRCCMHEHYEDCPWREQSLYVVDSRNQMLCTYAAFGDFRFARASLDLMGKDRRDDGLLHICFPSKVDLVIPFFSLFWVIQMREYAEASEDDTLIETYYEKMVRLLSVFRKREENGLLVNFYGDKRYWNFYEWNHTLSNAHRPSEKSFDLMLNATFLLALQNMATISNRIGKKQNADSFLAEANELNEEIRRAFYVPKTGLYRTALGLDGYSELANAFAVLCGAATGEIAKDICERIVRGKEMIPATLSMKAFVYDAMLETDSERYREWILNDIDKTYSAMLEQGATSFWETAEGVEAFHNAGSLCHGWSAMPIVYYRKLLSNTREQILDGNCSIANSMNTVKYDRRL